MVEKNNKDYYEEMISDAIFSLERLKCEVVGLSEFADEIVEKLSNIPPSFVDLDDVIFSLENCSSANDVTISKDEIMHILQWLRFFKRAKEEIENG